MDISICSYSFHRALASGSQDIFRFITDCKDLGCTLLDPWNSHLPEILSGDSSLQPAHDPSKALLSEGEIEYVAAIVDAAANADLPFGCIAVDGAHIYEESAEARNVNRQRAYRWLEVARLLSAKQVRIDAGGPAEMPTPAFEIIVNGYRELIDHASENGIEVIVENHWGPTVIPENVVRLLDAVPGLGYLFDTHNWRPELRVEGWRLCSDRATACHIKEFRWDAAGNPTGDDNVTTAIELLKSSGYRGCWGAESVPEDGDEYAGAANTVALIRRTAGA